MSKYKLLSEPTTNYKAKKNIKIGVDTYFLSLAHSDTSGYNVCPRANKLSIKENNPLKSSCSSVCVATNGNGNFPNVKKARERKTKLFFENRLEFMTLLVKDIKKAIENSAKSGNIPTFRLNAYSDIKWEHINTNEDYFGIVNLPYNFKPFVNIFKLFPDITFYDYTKLEDRKTPSNYHLTYSHFGLWDITNKVLNDGLNVAMVFNKNNPLPKEYDGIKVINGDKTDLRTKENDGNGVIVGLLAKMSKKNIENELSKDISFIVN